MSKPQVKFGEEFKKKFNGELIRRLEYYQKNCSGSISFISILHAYQPRINKQIKAWREPNPLLEDIERIKEFKELNKEIKEMKRKSELRNMGTIFDVVLDECYCRLFSLAEFFPNSISIDFPQVTLDEIKNFHPKFYSTLIKLSKGGIFDLGISSYHHALAPMIGEEEIKDEYLSSFESNQIAIGYRKFLTLHIPEEAVTSKLLNYLFYLSKRKGTYFILPLDSSYHNDGRFDIRNANKIYNENIYLLFRHNAFCNFVSNYLYGYLKERGQFEAGMKMFEEFLKSIFFDPYYSNEIGSKMCFVMNIDAETFGHHIPGAEYSYYVFLSLLNEFGFVPTSATKYISENESLITRNKVIENSWRGSFDFWFRPKTQFLRDKLKEMQSLRWRMKYYEDYYANKLKDIKLEPDALSEEKNDLLKRLKRILFALRGEYGNALLSCPYYFDDPNHPTVTQVIRCIERFKRNLDRAENIKNKLEQR